MIVAGAAISTMNIFVCIINYHKNTAPSHHFQISLQRRRGSIHRITHMLSSAARSLACGILMESPKTVLDAADTPSSCQRRAVQQNLIIGIRRSWSSPWQLEIEKCGTTCPRHPGQ
ncbi:hypothetical protein B0H34DRAFT_536249 [Crassisporium funariophilum]|nr:hypothetical protein B0H34DRAFT_536249 [Crassisporium funariophilum]